jgi:hypothetical protein
MSYKPWKQDATVPGSVFDFTIHAEILTLICKDISSRHNEPEEIRLRLGLLQKQRSTSQGKSEVKNEFSKSQTVRGDINQGKELEPETKGKFGEGKTKDVPEPVGDDIKVLSLFCRKKKR